jgi:hypothetical protein
LSFAQSVIQFHDAELFARRPQYDPDFASANPTVYTNLWLQIKSSSWPAKRECAAPPYFHLSQFPASAAADAKAPWLRRSCDLPRRSARANNREPNGSCRQQFGAGKANFVTIRIDLPIITLAVARQNAPRAPHTQLRHRASNRVSLLTARVLRHPKKPHDHRFRCRSKTPVVG